MMDVFDAICPYLFGPLEVSIQFIFFSRCIGKKGSPAQTTLFAALGCAIVHLPIAALLKLIIFTALLVLSGVFWLKASGRASVLYAVLTVEIMQLCFGAVNSVTGILSAFVYPLAPAVFSRLFMTAGELLALGLACLCYWAVFKNRENIHDRYIVTILTPLLTIFMVSEYINHSFYGNTVSLTQSWIPLDTSHIQMLIVQLLGIVSIFSILYAYQKLTASFSLGTRLSLLERQSHFQKQYVEEARARYDSTRSLRHDMKNHVLVVRGLLEREELEKAKSYIEVMDMATTGLSFPFQTGNAVLDILLENKAALAGGKGIAVSSSLKIPSPCAVGDMELCVILSNALDNAIHACEALGADDKKYIRISSRRQGDLLLIEVENSFNGDRRFKQGIGLSNIKRAAEKYGGAMDISTEDNMFRLSVLLVISQQPERVSQQTCCGAWETRYTNS